MSQPSLIESPPKPLAQLKKGPSRASHDTAFARREPDTHELEVEHLAALVYENRLGPSTEELLDRLRRSSSEWRATVDALDELIFMVDASGTILRTNRAFELWSLGSVRDTGERHWHDSVHPGCEHEDCYLRRAWRSFRRQELSLHPFVAEAEDAELGKYVEIVLHRIADPSSMEFQRSFAVIVLRDVTEIHRKRLQQWQQDQSEALSSFVRGLAHEIGNPLAAMKTSLQVLSSNFDAFDDAKKKAYLGRLLEGTNRIWSIVDQILHRGGRGIGAVRPVPLHSAATRARDVLVDQAAGRGVDLRTEASAPLQGYADADAVDEALLNVLQNALEACDPGDLVTIHVRPRGEWAQILVRDTGRGIPRQDLGKIFQPFFTTKTDGSGIGMTHVAHLMHQMGGRIEVDSSEGRGTEVRLSFRTTKTESPR